MSELRRVTYPRRVEAHPSMRKRDRCADCKRSESAHGGADHRFRSPADDPGGEGTEAARVLRLCPACHAAWEPAP